MSDIVVKTSQIDRKGIFASRDFKKGETVTVWDTSHIISPDEYDKQPEDVKEHISNLGNGQYLIVQEPESFINHSCEPNTHVVGTSDVALRDIKKGEEITSDFTSDAVGKYSFECNCGSKTCKGVIYY